MNYTNNLNLKKPDESDFYNVKDFNDNVDVIDKEISKLQPEVNIEGEWKRKVIVIDGFEMTYRSSGVAVCSAYIDLSNYLEDVANITDVVVVSFTDAQYKTYEHSKRSNPLLELCCARKDPNNNWTIQFNADSDHDFTVGRLVVDILYKKGN